MGLLKNYIKKALYRKIEGFVFSGFANRMDMYLYPLVFKNTHHSFPNGHIFDAGNL